LGERMYSSYSFSTSAVDGVSGQRHSSVMCGKSVEHIRYGPSSIVIIIIIIIIKVVADCVKNVTRNDDNNNNNTRNMTHHKESATS
jgi:hypothetical protein